MARTSAFERPESDIALKDLTTLLSRLRRILSLDYASNLSIYDVQKFKANCEYARALLLRLEHESASIKVASTKQSIQADLRNKRALIKSLQSQIQLVESSPSVSQHEEQDESEEDESEEDESVAASYEPKVLGLASSVDIEPSVAQEQAEKIASTLRSRKKAQQQPQHGSNPFGAKSTGTDWDGDVKSKEKMLDHDRAEQEQITEKLLSLTKDLKFSQTTFHDSLMGTMDDINKATSGLDNNISGMEKAGQRMGMLRKLTEGKGWWGRLILYGWVAGLWIILLIIMFVLPKLRF